MTKLKNEQRFGRLSVLEFKSAKKYPLVVVLENIRSLNNVGSVFRTADAFLIEKIVLCGITATPPHRDIQKTAIGATQTVEWEYQSKATEVLLTLKGRGYKTIAIEQTPSAIYLDDVQSDTNEKYVLVFGNEINGISQEVIDICDVTIEIPQSGSKHSLNVAVSVGVVLWEFFKRLR